MLLSNASLTAQQDQREELLNSAMQDSFVLEGIGALDSPNESSKYISDVCYMLTCFLRARQVLLTQFL